MNVLAEITYLAGTILFILGIRKMGRVDTSRQGNNWSMVGMALGIIAMTTVPLNDGHYGPEAILLIGIVIAMFALGGIVGYLSAVRVKLTALPEMVSLFNGLGGLCSMLIGLAEGLKAVALGTPPSPIIPVSILIGGVTVSGSIVAWSKLSGGIFSRIRIPAPQVVNSVFLIFSLAAVIVIATGTFPDREGIYFLAGICLIYGVTFVIPIGGGDMPVVISLLNSLSGIAAATAGLIYGNTFMITGGILVGASGTFLTVLMCRAMNRTLWNVIIGGFTSSGAGTELGDRIIRKADPTDLAIRLKYSSKVMIVPGYGMAVAQAQHALKELEKTLIEAGVQVFYAIHPVAGRMPGHMNVLLAEAQVSYDLILEMEAANQQFPATDIVLVIGANDVVNPDALDNPGSTIYGMPVMEVGKAQTVVVLKRSMNPGYAGIENPLFYRENTQMLFGDAKDSLQKLKAEVGLI